MGTKGKIPELNLGHSESNENEGIIVSNAVYNNEKQLERSFPHRHNFYVVCLINEGSGLHVIDFEEHDVKPNRLFIVSPHQIHFWKLNSNSHISLVQFSERILLFNNESVSNLLSTLMVNKNYIDLSTKQAGEIFILTQKLEQETIKSDYYSADIIRSYLTVLCRLIERMAEVQQKDGFLNPKENKMQTFRNLINTNYNQNKSVSFYASELNITPNYLNMLCRKKFGRSAGEMISARVILEAKRLLFHTISDISEIAYNLGFEDPSYFTRTFKRIEGKPPTEFREEIYKKYQKHKN